MNTLDLAQRKVKLNKTSEANGGEWQGPCPSCGGEDRFHVWPNSCAGQGGYWCRVCGKTGGILQFLRDFDGMSPLAARAELNIDRPERLTEAPGRLDPPTQCTKPVFEPVMDAPPVDRWQEQAEKFITWAQGGLANNAEALAWLAARGISGETARSFRLGWNAGEATTPTRLANDLFRPLQSWGLPETLEDDGRPKMLWIPRGLVIPYFIEGVIYRITIRRPDDEPHYYVLPGSAMSTMLLEPTRRVFVIVGSELDALAVVAANPLTAAVGLSSADAQPDAKSYAILQESLKILNALDFNTAGAKAVAWWSEQFRHCKRWPTLKGNGTCEAFQMGIDLNMWLMAGVPPVCTIENQVAGSLKISRVYAGAGFRSAPGGIERRQAISDPPSSVLELLALLRKYPVVKIINTPYHYAVLRNGKAVGGRFADLVFGSAEVQTYLACHPAAEINGRNLII